LSCEVVLAINPGSTSTKIGIFNRKGKVFVKSIDHSGTKIADMHSIRDQLPMRLKIINEVCDNVLNEHKLVAIVGRGGLLGPIKSGIYSVNEDIMDITINCRYASHASNLGASLAFNLAEKYKVPSYIVDPVTVDEMIPEARISGIPEIERRSRLHALNINACVRKAAQKLGKEVSELKFVIAHMGGGISVAAIDKGRIIDCNDALMGMGPFSPERAGAVPLEGLIDLAQTMSSKELKIKLTKNSGVKSYLGTSNMKDVSKMIRNGDKKATAICDAMTYQIGKEIGAMATTLMGDVDAIIYTGGIAYEDITIEKIHQRVKFIADKIVFPGENELESLAEGGFRAIDKLQEVITYKRTI